MDSHITIESFGSEVPANWEEIADFLNDIIDERGISEDHNAVNELWEDYCNCEISGAPKEDEHVIVKNAFGTWIDFEPAAEFMNPEIREELHYKLAPCTEQEFFTAYEKAHEEKFGEPWELSKKNPVW